MTPVSLARLHISRFTPADASSGTRDPRNSILLSPSPLFFWAISTSNPKCFCPSPFHLPFLFYFWSIEIIVRSKISSAPLACICVSVPGMFNWLVGRNCLIKQEVGALASAVFCYDWEVPWQGNWTYPTFRITDKAWLNINRTLLETGPEFNDTIVAHIHNLGFMLLTASSGIIMPFPPKACQVKEGRWEWEDGMCQTRFAGLGMGKTTDWFWLEYGPCLYLSFRLVHLLNISQAQLFARNCSTIGAGRQQ